MTNAVQRRDPEKAPTDLSERLQNGVETDVIDDEGQCRYTENECGKREPAVLALLGLGVIGRRACG
jgi:hypothetical protein